MGDDVVHRVVAESWLGIFRHEFCARKVATAPTCFAAEAETFRTRSLGERGA